MKIDYGEFGYTPVKPEDTFQFQCAMCGDCCRNVKDAIMIESYDLFNLTRHLKIGADEFILKYTNMAFLSWGYPILVLRTEPEQNSCVFLNNSKCGVQAAKPRACRTYPLGAGPDDSGGFESFIVSKKLRHFTGPSIRVSDWMDENLTAQDREAILADYAATKEFVKLLRMIDRSHEDRVVGQMLLYRFIDYDTSKDFYGQFTENIARLKRSLSILAGEKGGKSC